MRLIRSHPANSWRDVPAPFTAHIDSELFNTLSIEEVVEVRVPINGHSEIMDRLTYSPLVERKQRLTAILPKNSQSVLFCDHIEAAGEELRALACNRDLEGIVAKHKFGPYLQEAAQWFKIRNRKYSQWAGREKFFEREREVDPDMTVWDSCAMACEDVYKPSHE